MNNMCAHFQGLLFLGLLFFGVHLDGIGQSAIGIQLGGNLSNMDFNNNPDYRLEGPTYLQGFQGGLFFQHVAQPHVGIRVELNYVQRGWNEKENEDTGLKYRRRLNYLEVPFLSHIIIGSKKFRMTLDLGPYAGYLLGAREMITDVNTGESTENKVALDNDRDNRLDYGLMLGGGFEYDLPKGAIFVGARYTFGLGNIYKEKSTASELSQNRVITIQGGYFFEFGSKSESNTKPNKDQP